MLDCIAEKCEESDFALILLDEARLRACDAAFLVQRNCPEPLRTHLVT